MIDLLENKNPLLRHLSKSWLNQANQQYNKIIDPILLILLDRQLIFGKNKDNNTEFLKVFDTLKILDAFSKFKNIILNCPLIDFLKEKNLPIELLSMIRFESFEKENMFYLQALISITLHYIRTNSSDKLNDKFKKEILSVNAASCEFLEFLLNVIED